MAVKIYIGQALLLLALGAALGLPALVYAEEAQTEGWLDSSHAEVCTAADNLAAWVDGFFGNPQTDMEAASSIVRLRGQYEWDEQDGSGWKLRATGRLILPQLNERTSLVFQSDKDDADEAFWDSALAANQSAMIGLQHEIADDGFSRIDLTAALKSGPKGKLGGRYRYQIPWGEDYRFFFSEELFWIGGDGFGTLTRANIDHALDETHLLRWANRAEYSEESNGVDWSSRVSWTNKLNEQSALSVFGFVRGETSPEILKSRGFGLAYRRQFLRDWLYWELEPAYAWRKRKPDQERHGVAIIKLRLEISFGDD